MIDFAGTPFLLQMRRLYAVTRRPATRHHSKANLLNSRLDESQYGHPSVS
jgi:hypothetical protein